MKIRLTLLALFSLTLLLMGCSSVDVWPFDGKKESSQPRNLTNATEYQCAGGKRFHVRILDNGATAWLIYPDREVGLPKSTSASGTRYTNGVAVLDITGNEATLVDGPAISFTGCKSVANK